MHAVYRTTSPPRANCEVSRHGVAGATARHPDNEATTEDGSAPRRDPDPRSWSRADEACRLRFAGYSDGSGEPEMLGSLGRRLSVAASAAPVCARSSLPAGRLIPPLTAASPEAS